jgi:HSP20 family protein
MENSFLKKLKKGMDIAEEEEEEERVVRAGPKIKEIPIEIEEEEKKQEEEEVIEEPPQRTIKTQKKEVKVKKKGQEEWPEAEGQLAVDVYQTDEELVVQSAIAGVEPDDLNVTIEGDLLSIKGKRKKPKEEKGDYFYQECYWGEFSRQIILPVEVDPGRIDACLQEGILMIRVPKIVREGKKKVKIKRA